METETSIVTVRRDGNRVALTVDGITTTRSFETESAAIECYVYYRDLIKNEEEKNGL